MNNPDSPPPPVNYRAIATASGVGKSTVGRVLHGGGYVGADTRARVLEAAARLGYRPDPALGALSRRRWPLGAKPATTTLAYLFSARNQTTEADTPEYQGMRRRADELGYSVDAFRIEDYPRAEALSRVIYSRGIQGVIIRAFQDSLDLELDWARFHAVFLGPENDLASVHNVQADFRSALHLAVVEALRRKSRRPGFALMNFLASGTNVPFQAQALYEKNRLEKKLGPLPEIFLFEPGDHEGGEYFQWLRLHRPDFIIATNSQPWHWLQSALRSGTSKKKKNPDFLFLRKIPELPTISHIDLREEEQGRQTVDFLHQQLQHGVIGRPEIPLRILVPPILRP